MIKDQENNWPLLADFNNRDEEGAVRSIFPFTNLKFADVHFEPKTGQKIWLSDGDVELKGTLELKNGNWVVVPDEEGFSDVDKDAPYNTNSLSLNRK